MEVFSGAVLLLPWVVTGITLLGAGLLAWKVGYPAVRILALEQHVKLLEVRLQTAQEAREMAESRIHQLENRLEEATAELKVANKRIAAFLTVVELKSGAKEAFAVV